MEVENGPLEDHFPQQVVVHFHVSSGGSKHRKQGFEAYLVGFLTLAAVTLGLYTWAWAGVGCFPLGAALLPGPSKANTPETAASKDVLALLDEFTDGYQAKLKGRNRHMHSPQSTRPDAMQCTDGLDPVMGAFVRHARTQTNKPTNQKNKLYIFYKQIYM